MSVGALSFSGLFRFGLAVWIGVFTAGSLAAQPPETYQLDVDWLVHPEGFIASIQRDEATGRLTLSNGLVRREFLVRDGGFATVGYDDVGNGRSLIRAIKPEASVTIDGREYPIGGMLGQPNQAFLRSRDLTGMKFDPAAMRLVGIEECGTVAPFSWKRLRHHAPNAQWPPAGVGLRFDFEPGASVESQEENPGDALAGEGANVRVSLHYELYDGIPLMAKWLTVENVGDTAVSVDRFTAERLALVEHSNPVETRDGVALPRPRSLHVETDMAFGGFKHEQANRHAVHYRPDPSYQTQVNYLRKMPCLLEVEPTYGPAQTVSPGERFTSFRVFELVMDSSSRERRGLAQRRMYRTLAPWVTENPLMHHMRVADPKLVRRAIDDAAAVGFEMVILSFGSGFNAENDSPEYLRSWSEMRAYAAERGIELGCYSLYSSRRIGGGNDIVPPEGQQATHGVCPAITSEWGQAYLRKLYGLFEATEMTVFEHDGPYPGDVDVTERLPLQKGEQDSRWVHWRTWAQFYQWLRGRGVYLNAPDFYFLSGSNKCGMGYRETNWSLPRGQQLIHTRQNIFDGTWDKAPSMGWMFVPLSEYHGGGAAATIEPLDEHLDHYERMLLSNLAFGVQACYRGPRLFDTPRVKAMVSEHVAWFKAHREILESDVVHLRRADGQHLDGMLHVNSALDERAMLCVFNPTDQTLRETWKVPLYYAGLADRVEVTRGEGSKEVFTLDRFQRASIELEVPANGFQWWVFREVSNEPTEL